MTTRDNAWPQGTPCWADLMVDDVAKARDFYGTLFGWEFAESPDSGGYVICLKDGRPAAGIGPKSMAGDAAKDMPSNWTVYLAVDDADAITAAAKAAGATVFEGPMDIMQYGRMAVMADPTGPVFGVWQAGEHTGAGIANVPGAMCWNDVNTTDYEAAQDFYRTVFGYTYTEVGDGKGGRYATFAVPGSDEVRGGVGEATQLPPGVPGYWSTCFAVADVDASLEVLTLHGGTIMMPAEDTPHGRFAVVAGPEGDSFALITFPS